jgi:hypothetical protein
VHHHPSAAGRRERARRQRQVRCLAHAVIGAGGGDQWQAGRRAQLGRGVAQALGESRQLLDALALQAHRDEERAGLRRAHRAGQQRAHCLAGLGEGQRAPAALAGADGLDRRAEAVVLGAARGGVRRCHASKR